jgi:hypothetical protein
MIARSSSIAFFFATREGSLNEKGRRSRDENYRASDSANSMQARRGGDVAPPASGVNLRRAKSPRVPSVELPATHPALMVGRSFVFGAGRTGCSLDHAEKSARCERLA